MSTHSIQAFAPGVSFEHAASYLLAALARAGRQVITRRSLGLAEPPEPLRAGSLYWTVRQSSPGDTRVLLLQEGGASSWDLVFLRALSEVSDGVVVACDEDASAGRHGQASFLGGRTLEVATTFPLEAPVTIGSRNLREMQEASLHADVFRGRFAQFLDVPSYQEHEFETLVTEEWLVTPARAPFSTDEERPATWMLMAPTSAEQWRAAGGVRMLPRGWRARAFKGPNLLLPYIELHCEGLVTLQEFLETTRRLDCAGLLLEVPGRGAPFSWTRAVGAEVVEDTGLPTNTEELAWVLSRIASYLLEPPGILLGRGQEGWETALGP